MGGESGEAMKRDDNQKNKHMWSMGGWALASEGRLHETTPGLLRVKYGCRWKMGAQWS